MKILALNGSLNSTGTTALVIDVLLKYCGEEGAECERVNIGDYTIDSCSECGNCTDNHECCRDDDYLQLKAKLLEADGIIIGSPYHSGNPSVHIKLFMDRLFSSDTYNSFSGKYIVGLATSAKDDCKGLAKYCATLGKSGFLCNGIISGIIYEAIINDYGVSDLLSNKQLNEKVKRCAKRFVLDIKDKNVPISSRLKRYLLKKHLGRFALKLMKGLNDKFSDIGSKSKKKTQFEGMDFE